MLHELFLTHILFYSSDILSYIYYLSNHFILVIIANFLMFMDILKTVNFLSS